MKLVKFFAFGVAALCAALFVASCGKADQAASKTLVMATNAEFPPYEFREGDKITGIDVDMMQAICAKLGYTLKIEDMGFDSIIPAVTTGKADVGVAGMTVTEDRKKNVDFTETYKTAYQVIIVKKGSPIKGKADLAKKRIGVQTGTTGDTEAGNIEGVTMNRFAKGAEAVMALTQDKVDAVVIDIEPAKAFVAKNANLMILEEPLTDEAYAMAVKKGNAELLAQLNNALAELKKSGELDAIFAKYNDMIVKSFSE